MFKKLVYLGIAAIFFYGLIAIYQKASDYFGFTLEWKDWLIIGLILVVILLLIIAISISKAAGNFLGAIMTTFGKK